MDLPLPGPLSILLDSPVLLDMPWIHIFTTTLGCVFPGIPFAIGEYLLTYICQQWALVAEERPDREQALFLRDMLIIEALADNPVLTHYFDGMRMRLQISYATLEMEALATGYIGCEDCRCC